VWQGDYTAGGQLLFRWPSRSLSKNSVNQSATVGVPVSRIAGKLHRAFTELVH
jgi:hypothetical protein